MGSQDESPEAPSEPTAPDEAPDQGLTARDRRRQRVKESQRKQMPAKTGKMLGIAALVIVLLAAGVWGIGKLNELRPTCELEGKHEHATFHVYDEGQRLRFQHPKFDMQGPGRSGVLPPKLHMHQPDDAQMHAEFGCATMGDFFRYVGGDLKADRLALPPEVGGGKVLANEGNKTLRFFLFEPDHSNPPQGTWSEKPEIPRHQPRDCQRILITYGDPTQEQIQQQQDAVDVPTDSRNCRSLQ